MKKQLHISKVSEIITSRRSLFDEMDALFSRADDFFSGFLPGFLDRDRGRVRGKNFYFEAILSPKEAIEDGTGPRGQGPKTTIVRRK